MMNRTRQLETRSPSSFCSHPSSSVPKTALLFTQRDCPINTWVTFGTIFGDTIITHGYPRFPSVTLGFSNFTPSGVERTGTFARLGKCATPEFWLLSLKNANRHLFAISNEERM